MCDNLLAYHTLKLANLWVANRILWISKLSNVDDCIRHGYIKPGQSPIEVASKQFLSDNVSVLHIIGGKDNIGQAADISNYLKEYGSNMIVLCMPVTIDNDVCPINQTFGAETAAQQGARFFRNVVNECTANPRMLIVHECMGRDCGYLTAATALEYRKILAKQTFPEPTSFPYTKRIARDVHAVFIPELKVDLATHGARLKRIMDTVGCVNVFFGEGTGAEEVVAEMEAHGVEVARDAFGNPTLSKLNTGQFFAERLGRLVEAEKSIVQKSGYFARAASPNKVDVELIGRCAQAGVENALQGVSGVMGQDEEKEGNPIRAIEFDRIKVGKPFDTSQPWFQDMLKEIGQTA